LEQSVHPIKKTSFNGDTGLVKIQKSCMFAEIIRVLWFQPEAYPHHGPGAVGDGSAYVLRRECREPVLLAQLVKAADKIRRCVDQGAIQIEQNG
jgi:hypothetical protein